jgi:osmotically-inducible protein OsmY
MQQQGRQAMNSKMRYLGAFMCLVVIFAISACAGDRDRTSRSAGQVAEDNAIAARVKSALIADPQVKGTQVDVEVFKGVVQLSGFVDNTTNVQKAVSIARSVPGVKEVRNSLQAR